MEESRATEEELFELLSDVMNPESDSFLTSFTEAIQLIYSGYNLAK